MDEAGALTQTLVVPNTGGFQIWRVVDYGSVDLQRGVQVLSLETPGGGFNLDWIDLAGTTTDGLFATKVNFQPATAPTIAGYLVDAGSHGISTSTRWSS